MSDQSPLFRSEALAGQAIQLHGRILIASPPGARAYVVIATVLVIAAITFACMGTYTRRVTVMGQIVASTGLVKLYALQPSVVIESYVQDGDTVHKGDVLFVLSTERQTSLGASQAAISAYTESRKRSLAEQLGSIALMESTERKVLQGKIDSYAAELRRLRSMSESQRERIGLAERMLNRVDALQREGFTTEDHTHQKRAELLEQRAKLDALSREMLATRRGMEDAQGHLENNELKYRSQAAEIERAMTLASQELTESEARRSQIIIATENGVVTAVTARLGQIVDANKPLLAIVPKNATLEAELYAPSRAVGFIRAGDKVSLRYEAFPYQKFGQHQGIVQRISSTAMSSNDLTGTNAFAQGSRPGGEPMYRILVQLQSQSVTAYGADEALQVGMLLDADLRQQTRVLYEWALDPLYTIGKKL
jgi:membrane fusion protein